MDKRAGDAVIRQPWSQYNKTIYFEELDITPLLHKGSNVLGVMLGNSFWVNPPAPPEQIPQRRSGDRLRAAFSASGRCRHRRRGRRAHPRGLGCKLEEHGRPGHLQPRLRRRGLRCPPGAAGLGQARLRRPELDRGHGGGCAGGQARKTVLAAASRERSLSGEANRGGRSRRLPRLLRPERLRHSAFHGRGQGRPELHGSAFGISHGQGRVHEAAMGSAGPVPLHA